MFSVVERLEQHPSAGRIPIELKDGRYREVIYGPCLIVYRQSKNQVFVLYVMRSERQLRNFLLEGRGLESS